MVNTTGVGPWAAFYDRNRRDLDFMRDRLPKTLDRLMDSDSQRACRVSRVLALFKSACPSVPGRTLNNSVAKSC